MRKTVNTQAPTPATRVLSGLMLAGLTLAAAPALAEQQAAAGFGFDVAGMDRSVQPGNNFYNYANGTYVAHLTIPPDQSAYGAFNKLRDLSEQRTHDILEKAASGGGTGQIAKAGLFYKAFMDEAAVETKGLTPLKADLDQARAIASAADFARVNGLATKSFLGSIVDTSIAPDSKDPTKYSITLSQSGLAMPDRDYYLSPEYADARGKYTAFIEHLLTLAGWPDAHAAATRIADFETAIAKASWDRAARRDDDKTYNPTTLADLQKAAPDFDWAAYFNAAGLGSPDRVVLSENTAIVQIAELAAKTPVQTLRDWEAFHVIVDASGVLPKAFVDARFDFYGKTLQGQPQDKPRWKRAVAATEGALGEAIGQEYVAQFYPPVARQQMDILTAALRQAFHERLEHNTWMTPETKQKALDKLATFDFQIGNPKKWRDYSALDVQPDDAYGNAERAVAFEWNFWLGHLGKPVDRDLWEMFPQTVNAYNEPLLNEVVFPAAILQPPFFDPNADPAINYGAIGGVIGHEMTHSFDDQGRKHDAMGRLHNWWTAEDAKRFEAKAKQYGAEFARMNILPGAHINPALTMGENIADLGGLTLALQAYHDSLHGQPAPVVDGFSGDQRVFLGWAQVWRAKVRDAAARQRLTIDPHSPPMARVNGPIQNIDAWYDAFGVKEGQTMYLAPDQRVVIW
jgi:putative endopeptidase